MDMTKRSVKALLGFEKDTELARFLGISKQAVSQMGDDDQLPEGRQWQLVAKRPDLFAEVNAAPRPLSAAEEGTTPVNRAEAANDAAATEGDGTELKDAA